MLVNTQTGQPIVFYSNFFEFGERLFFVGKGSTYGLEPWVSDGTPEGTALFKDLAPGSASSTPQVFRAMGDNLYILDGYQVLWKSDGSSAGTIPVRKVPRSADAGGSKEHGTLKEWFFFSVGSIDGGEVWRSDGTMHRTIQLADIYPGRYSSAPREFTVMRDYLYFSADDGIGGRELWGGDGTPGGTVRVADIREGKEGSDPQYLVVGDGLLFFTADDGVHGRELWAIPAAKAPTPVPEYTEKNLFLPLIRRVR